MATLHVSELLIQKKIVSKKGALYQCVAALVLQLWS